MDDCGLDNDDMRLINTMIERRVRKYQIIMAICMIVSICLAFAFSGQHQYQCIEAEQIASLSQRLNDHIEFNNRIWKTIGETVKIQTECIEKLDHRLDRQCTQFSLDLFKANEQIDNLTVMTMKIESRRRDMNARIIAWVEESVVFLLQKIDLGSDNHHGYNHPECPQTH